MTNENSQQEEIDFSEISPIGSKGFLVLCREKALERLKKYSPEENHAYNHMFLHADYHNGIFHFSYDDGGPLWGWNRRKAQTFFDKMIREGEFEVVLRTSRKGEKTVYRIFNFPTAEKVKSTYSDEKREYETKGYGQYSGNSAPKNKNKSVGSQSVPNRFLIGTNENEKKPMESDIYRATENCSVPNRFLIGSQSVPTYIDIKTNEPINKKNSLSNPCTVATPHVEQPTAEQPIVEEENDMIDRFNNAQPDAVFSVQIEKPERVEKSQSREREHDEIAQPPKTVADGLKIDADARCYPSQGGKAAETGNALKRLPKNEFGGVRYSSDSPPPGFCPKLVRFFEWSEEMTAPLSNVSNAFKWVDVSCKSCASKTRLEYKAKLLYQSEFIFGESDTILRNCHKCDKGKTEGDMIRISDGSKVIADVADDILAGDGGMAAAEYIGEQMLLEIGSLSGGTPKMRDFSTICEWLTMVAPIDIITIIMKTILYKRKSGDINPIYSWLYFSKSIIGAKKS